MVSEPSSVTMTTPCSVPHFWAALSINFLTNLSRLSAIKVTGSNFGQSCHAKLIQPRGVFLEARAKVKRNSCLWEETLADPADRVSKWPQKDILARPRPICVRGGQQEMAALARMPSVLPLISKFTQPLMLVQKSYSFVRRILPF